MAEPLFDFEECPPVRAMWLYCENCTSAWAMHRKDAVLCPACGERRFREITPEELVALAANAMGSSPFVEALIGSDDVPHEVTEFARVAAKIVQKAVGGAEG